MVFKEHSVSHGNEHLHNYPSSSGRSEHQSSSNRHNRQSGTNTHASTSSPSAVRYSTESPREKGENVGSFLSPSSNNPHSPYGAFTPSGGNISRKLGGGAKAETPVTPKNGLLNHSPRPTSPYNVRTPSSSSRGFREFNSHMAAGGSHGNHGFQTSSFRNSSSSIGIESPVLAPVPRNSSVNGLVGSRESSFREPSTPPVHPHPSSSPRSLPHHLPSSSDVAPPGGPTTPRSATGSWFSLGRFLSLTPKGGKEGREGGRSEKKRQGKPRGAPSSGGGSVVPGLPSRSSAGAGEGSSASSLSPLTQHTPRKGGMGGLLSVVGKGRHSRNRSVDSVGSGAEEGSVAGSIMTDSEVGAAERLRVLAPGVAEPGTLASRYDFGPELGRGTFGIVRECRERATGKLSACKTVGKEKLLYDGDVEDLRVEVAAMKAVRGHESIVQLKGVYEDDENVHLILELCEGGDLFQRVRLRKRFAEREAAQLVSSLVSAIAHCWEKGVMHRDLKPENILMASNDSDSDIRVADFGKACFANPGEMKTEIVGTPFYLPPEVLHGRYGLEADMWCVGVILYILLSGRPPFFAKEKDEIFALIDAGRFNVETGVWAHVSGQAKDLVRRMLTKDATERIRPGEVQEHPWIVRHTAPKAAQGDETIPSPSFAFNVLASAKVSPRGHGSSHKGKASKSPTFVGPHGGHRPSASVHDLPGVEGKPPASPKPTRALSFGGQAAHPAPQRDDPTATSAAKPSVSPAMKSPRRTSSLELPMAALNVASREERRPDAGLSRVPNGGGSTDGYPTRAQLLRMARELSVEDLVDVLAGKVREERKELERRAEAGKDDERITGLIIDFGEGSGSPTCTWQRG